MALALVAGPVMGWRFARSDTGFDKVRMMTFNIKSYLAQERFGGYADIAEEIERHSPDLLVMQDAQILVNRPSSEAGKVMQRALRGRERAFRHTHNSLCHVLTLQAGRSGCRSAPGCLSGFGMWPFCGVAGMCCVLQAALAELSLD